MYLKYGWDIEKTLYSLSISDVWVITVYIIQVIHVKLKSDNDPLQYIRLVSYYYNNLLSCSIYCTENVAFMWFWKNIKLSLFQNFYNVNENINDHTYLNVAVGV